MQKNNKKNELTFDLQDKSSWPLRRGMTRQVVRSLLGSNFETFVKNPGFSLVPTDGYVNEGVHVYYDENDQVVGIELLCGTLARALLNKTDILGAPVEFALPLIKNSRCPIFSPTEDGFDSEDHEICLFIPNGNERGRIEAVSLVFH